MSVVYESKHSHILLSIILSSFWFSISTVCECHLWVPTSSHFTEHNPLPFSISTGRECCLWISTFSYFTEHDLFPFPTSTGCECCLWALTSSHFTERTSLSLQRVSVVYEPQHSHILLNTKRILLAFPITTESEYRSWVPILLNIIHSPSRSLQFVSFDHESQISHVVECNPPFFPISIVCECRL